MEELIKQEFNKFIFESPDKISPQQRITDLEAFTNRFCDDISFDEYKETVYYMKAEALYKLQRYEEALKIYEAVYRSKPVSIDIVIAQRIADILLKFNKKSEAVSIIDNAIKEQAHLPLKLDLLYWYSDNIGDELFKFKNEIEDITNYLGIPIPDDVINLPDLISFLQTEKIAAGRRYGEMIIKTRKLSPSEKLAVLKRFVDEEPVVFFREQAKKSLELLE